MGIHIKRHDNSKKVRGKGPVSNSRRIQKDQSCPAFKVVLNCQRTSSSCHSPFRLVLSAGNSHLKSLKRAFKGNTTPLLIPLFESSVFQMDSATMFPIFFPWKLIGAPEQSLKNKGYSDVVGCDYDMTFQNGLLNKRQVFLITTVDQETLNKTSNNYRNPITTKHV